MGIRVYSLLWVMQDFVHQPYEGSDDPGPRSSCRCGNQFGGRGGRREEGLGFREQGLGFMFSGLGFI